jgi:hypothetical protein
MRGKIVLAGLILSLSALAAQAQSNSPAPFPNDIYCAGVVTTADVPKQNYIISGEESDKRLTFDYGDIVFINKGSDEGAKVGDRFSIIRPVSRDELQQQWTKWQFDIFKKMGTLWADEGRVRLVIIQPKTSVGIIEHECDMLQRGDIAVPFTEEQPPAIKTVKTWDRFGPPDGKAKAMVIAGMNFRDQFGTNDIAYVNLGNSQGVHVGDYFRIFRYTGTEHEEVFQTPGYSFDQQFFPGPLYGFGTVPKSYNWENTPREVIGEGVVLRTGTNASTVLITFASREIYAGYYVELE